MHMTRGQHHYAACMHGAASTYSFCLTHKYIAAKCRAAQALALQRMLEEDAYWCLVYTLWAREDGWRLTCPAYLGDILKPMRSVLEPMFRWPLIKELLGQARRACLRDA